MRALQILFSLYCLLSLDFHITKALMLKRQAEIINET
jgi:hypothetical protein